MREDEEVFYMGEDVADYGGIFDSTQGLLDEFGHDRVMDVPISETAYLGAAVGAAQAGMRPIAELMFVDFFGVAMDQIYNQMAKNTYMSGASVSVMVMSMPSCCAAYAVFFAISVSCSADGWMFIAQSPNTYSPRGVCMRK